MENTENLKQLVKYPLDFNITLDYVIESIDDANYFSDFLLKKLDFEEGNFFTLLPENIDSAKIHLFSCGGILAQNPMRYGTIGELVGIYEYSEISSITDKLAELIEELLRKNTDMSCVIDDIIRVANDPIANEDKILNHIFFHGQEVYYLLNYMNARTRLIMQCLQYSRALWHSLCVISKTPITKKPGQQLQDSFFNDICAHVQLVIIGSYDGEGYVFWEKKHDKSLSVKI